MPDTQLRSGLRRSRRMEWALIDDAAEPWWSQVYNWRRDPTHPLHQEVGADARSAAGLRLPDEPRLRAAVVRRERIPRRQAGFSSRSAARAWYRDVEQPRRLGRAHRLAQLAAAGL